MRRLPVYILIDVSESMVGEPIEAVRDGVQRLLSSLRRDPYALESVWISLITFENNANVLVPLTELSEFHCPEITLSNNIKRNLGLGVQQLCEQYNKEIKKTTQEYKGDWLPIAIIMTSGDPSDTKNFETTISQLNDFPFAKIIVCVTGAKEQRSILKRITKDVFSLDTMDSNAFSRFWRWVSTVASAQSRSIDSNQEILPPPPPELNLFYQDLNSNLNSNSNTVETVEQSLPISPPPVPPITQPQTTPKINIFKAVKQNDLTTVKQLLQINPNLVSAEDKWGYTPLHLVAFSNSNVDVLKYLIENGADVNAKNKDGMTPLHYAAYNSNVDVLKYFVEKGANVNAKNTFGWTPLHDAAKYNSNVDVLKYLVEKGADVNAKDEKGRTLIHDAACNSNVDVLKYLVEKRADVNAKSKYGNTPLHFAARSNSNVGVLKYLVEKGAKINAKNRNGTTPLDSVSSGWENNAGPKERILRNAGAKTQQELSTQLSNCACLVLSIIILFSSIIGLVLFLF